MYRYDRNVVLAAYRAQHPRDLAPSEGTLTRFDADLFKRFDAEIRRRAPEEDIPLDSFSQSVLALFAAQSTATAVKTQVTHACRFFNSVRPQPTQAMHTGPGATAVPDDPEDGG